MIHMAHINPKLSTYYLLESPHDFNKTPWAPPETQAVIEEPTENDNLGPPEESTHGM